MSHEDRERWDAKYAARPSRSPGAPSAWLEQLLPRLPRGGRALDLAAGDGANALLLASRGWKVTAVDISPVGLALGRRVAGALRIDWVEADLEDYLPAGPYDLVTCFRFLDRRRLGPIVASALAPGGLLAIETFNRRVLEVLQNEAEAPRNPEYLLELGEWPRHFPDYEILEHGEEGTLSRLFARRPEG